jgi:hypothetical protein
MSALLLSGFKNNINIIAIRASARTQVYTDRAIDLNGDGIKEAITSVGVPTGTGIKVQQTVTVNQGAARTIVEGSDAESVNTQDGDTYYTLSNH